MLDFLLLQVSLRYVVVPKQFGNLSNIESAILEVVVIKGLNAFVVGPSQGVLVEEEGKELVEFKEDQFDSIPVSLLLFVG